MIAGVVKPRIKILQGGLAWGCSSESFGQGFSGYGTNPREAFESLERCKAMPMRDRFSWTEKMIRQKAPVAPMHKTS